MPRSFRIFAATAGIVALSSLLLGATLQPPFDPLKAVPQGALAVVSAGDPGILVDNSIKFLYSAGLDEQAAALEKALAPILNTEAGLDGMDERTATLLRLMDPRRRLLLAVYPGQEDPSDVSILVMIPIQSGPDALTEEELAASIEGLMPDSEENTTLSISHPGYFLIGAEGFDVALVGSSPSLDLSGLSAYPASSLVLWADVGVGAQYIDLIEESLGSLLSGTDDASDWSDDDYDWSDEGYSEGEMYQGPLDNVPFLVEPFDDDYFDDESFYYDPLDNIQIAIDKAGYEDELPEDEYAEDFSWDEYEAADDTALNPVKGIFDTLTEDFMSDLDEVESIEVALTVQADRAWFRVGSRLAKGGKLAGMASRASAGDKSMPYLSYCETGALMSVAWSAPSDWSVPILEDFYQLIMPEATFLDTVMSSFKAFSAASGMNGSTSIGVDVSEELAQAIRSGEDLEDAEAMKLISRGITLSVSGAMELTDRQSFRDTTASMLDLVNEPDYVALMAESGLAFDVNRKVGTVRGMPYDRYSYSFSAAESAESAESVESDDEMLAVVSELMGNLLSPVYVYKGDKAYMGLGKPESLNGLIDRDSAKAPLRNDKAFKALRAGAPADTRALFYLSTKELARLLLRLLPESQEPLDFNINGLSGLLSWLDASPGSAGFGLGIGAEDIKALMAISKK